MAVTGSKENKGKPAHCKSATNPRRAIPASCYFQAVPMLTVVTNRSSAKVARVDIQAIRTNTATSLAELRCEFLSCQRSDGSAEEEHVAPLLFRVREVTQNDS
jgi:hypothetical protein